MSLKKKKKEKKQLKKIYYSRNISTKSNGYGVLIVGNVE